MKSQLREMLKKKSRREEIKKFLISSSFKKMKIIFAQNIGFCSGVKRAIAIAENSLKKDPKPVQFLGPLIHNERVVKELKKKGGKLISDLKEIKSGTLILRAHGEVLDLKKIKKKKILIRETICPIVKRAQEKANFLFNQGYKVIIIGDKKHPETKGIKRSTKNQALIIENENQAKKLATFKKIGVVAQTTQDLVKFKRILKILKNKCQKIKWFNTICPEVLSRQKELSQLLEKTNGILVIGSQFSANTKRLVEIAKNAKKRVFWVNSLEELKKELKKDEFKNNFILGVVSGTSTPNWEIEKIKKYFERYG
jgi:4-hydroxy-3-methylbut-2-enyl diphosphate reductase